MSSSMLGSDRLEALLSYRAGWCSTRRLVHRRTAHNGAVSEVAVRDGTAVPCDDGPRCFPENLLSSKDWWHADLPTAKGSGSGPSLSTTSRHV